MEISYINNKIEVFPYILNNESYEAIEESFKLYNPITGPIQNIVSCFGMRNGFPTYVGHCNYYDIDEIVRKMINKYSMNVGIKNTLFAGGKGITLSDMILGSLSETIERVIGSYAYFDSEIDIIYGTYNSLKPKGINCIEPEKIHLFHEEQYKEKNFQYKPFTRESWLGWIKGKGLVSGKEIYVPAQLIMMFYSLKPKETIIGYATSGGLTCHINIYEGVYHGICELIERDAVNIRWVSRIPPEKILFNINDISSEKIKEVMDSIKKLPLEIELYYHSLDIKEVAVVTVISIDDYLKRYSYLAGGGVDIDIEKAIIGAITEFTQAEKYLRLALFFSLREYSSYISNIFGIEEDAPISNIIIFFKVIVYYGYKKNLEKLKWYFQGKKVDIKSLPSIKLKNAKEKYEYIINVMKKYNIDPIFFDFTPKFLKNLKVTKVFIPELTLPFLASYPYFGHPRYFELPMKLGLSKNILSYKDIVKDPHPYP